MVNLLIGNTAEQCHIPCRSRGRHIGKQNETATTVRNAVACNHRFSNFSGRGCDDVSSCNYGRRCPAGSKCLCGPRNSGQPFAFFCDRAKYCALGSGYFWSTNLPFLRLRRLRRKKAPDLALALLCSFGHFACHGPMGRGSPAAVSWRQPLFPLPRIDPICFARRNDRRACLLGFSLSDVLMQPRAGFELRTWALAKAPGWDNVCRTRQTLCGR